MSGLELNKIAAAILLASLIAMIAGIVANALYKPVLKPQNRGFSIAVTEPTLDSATQEVKEFKPDIAELMKVANASLGKELSKKCLTCHSFEKGGQHRVGPNLWNIVGAEKAKATGYKYSSALIAKGGNWDEESLFYLLHKPSKFVPGTKMSFPGLAKPEEIANIIAYLKTLHE